MTKQDINNISEKYFGNRANLLELLFDRMPMGIAILDREYNIQQYNPTWEEFAVKYRPKGGKPLSPGVNYFDHLPGSEPFVLPLYERVLDGEAVYQEGVKLDTGETITFWDVTLAPLIDGNNIVGILNVSVDATERMEVQQNLEERVLERTQELDRRRMIAESLHEIVGIINSGKSLEETLKLIAKSASQVMESEVCLIHKIDYDQEYVSIEASFGLPEDLKKVPGFPLYSSQKADEKILNREPVWGVDSQDAQPLKEEDLAHLHPDVKTWRLRTYELFRTWLAIPLLVENEIYGSLAFYFDKTKEIDDEEIRLSQSLADQVALAIENARLHQSDQDRQNELQILLDIAATANSSLKLDDLLTRTLDLLVSLVGASRAGVSLIDDDTGYLNPAVLRPKRSVDAVEMAKMMEAGQEVIDSGEMMYVAPDVSKGLLEPGALLPLQIRGRKLGMLGIIGQEGNVFSPVQLTLFRSIADQLGVAIENARLYEQAEEAAIAAERSRLARDLHDAVTQTLFSSSMIADVLPKIWERDGEEGKRRLEELRQLTRGALSEMRTLLVELRPTALEDTNLEDLVGHQVNAFTARTRLPVESKFDCHGNLPLDIKEMFYRIVQEGLNNIAKHADASNVHIQLNYQTDKAKLVIEDDGIGYDLKSTGIEGLGLGIMQERARNLGAELKISSEIWKGTKITVMWEATDSGDKQ